MVPTLGEQEVEAQSFFSLAIIIYVYLFHHPPLLPGDDMGPRKIPMATHNNELLIVYPQGNAVESKDRDNKLKLCANSSLIQMNCISLKPPAHINNNAKHEEEEELYLTITHTSLAVSHSRETMGGKRVISPCHVLLYLCGVHMACVATQKHLRDHGCC